MNWLLKRRLKKAARLLASGAIDRVDYAVLAVDTIHRLNRAPIRPGDRVSVLTFGVEALTTLGFRGSEFETPEAVAFGPVNEAVGILWDRFPLYSGSGDVIDKDASDFVWGVESGKLAWRAHLRLRLLNRLLERFDRWRREQAEFAPAVHDDLWKTVLAIVGAVLGFVIGRLTAP